MATQFADAGTEIPGEGVPNDNTEQQTEVRDYEAEARAQGWRPKEEFRGNPDAWTDAETFVKRADEVLPLIKKQNAHLKREIDDLKKLVRKVTASERASHTNALAEIRAQMEEAVETGDVAAFKKLDAKADKLRSDIVEDTPGLVHGEDPQEAFDSFRETNSWYDKANLASASETEIEARLFADRLADKYAKQGLQDTMAPSEFFAKIADETETKFPLLKARAARAKPASDVAGVTRPGAGSKAKTGANLPADARAQATRFHAQGVYGKKTLSEALDAYAKSFDWS
jgi:hypothetical protein